MKGLAFNQVTRATLLAAGIDGTLTRKLHGVKSDDGDGERDGEGLLDGDGDRLGDGITMLDTSGTLITDALGSLLDSGTLISDGDRESYEGPPALETVMMTARMTTALNILLILLFPFGC